MAVVSTRLGRPGGRKQPDRGHRWQQGVFDLRRPRKLTRSQPPLRTYELTIDRLGTDGAGLVQVEERLVVVPGGLPAERVLVEWRGGNDAARLIRVLSPNTERIQPICRHFTQCGGCSLQHLNAELLARMKQDRIRNALSRVGLSAVEILPTATSSTSSRRRATFEAVQHQDRVILGFHEASSHQIVGIDVCAVLHPSIVAMLPDLRSLLRSILANGDHATVTISACDSGLDIGLTLPGTPDLAVLELLAAFAETRDLARIWWRTADIPPIPAAVRRTPTVRLGQATVELPPGSFQQATRDGEQTLIGDVQAAIGTASRVADLFAGIGTFTLPLAVGRQVHAVEQNPPALTALAAAARGAGFQNVRTERRDLDARPLTATELDKFDAVIIDPPRAGAKAQMAQLARSSVSTIISISCDPATFARDAAVLLEGGYRLEQVRPVDQFLWSSHVELSAVFRR